MLKDEFGHNASITPAQLMSIDMFWRATNYLAVAQLYLRDNALLERPLRGSDFKERIVGHWGAIPGINFIYAHLCDLARRTDLPIAFVLGTGHAAPAILACLYLEGTLERYYPSYTRTRDGLNKFVCSFARYNGFQTEVSAHVPGTILAGGELGQALSVAQGAALDNSDLVIACVVGDGELETGPAASALLGSRVLQSTQAGIVVPLVNLNGFKMGSISVFSTFSDAQLQAYFYGLGYTPIIVGPSHYAMAEALDWVASILTIGESDYPRQNPLLIFRSPKGWTGPREMNDQPFEGSVTSHKPLLRNPARSPSETTVIEQWLRSYHPEELFAPDGSPRLEVLNCLPPQSKRLSELWERHDVAKRVSLTIPVAKEVSQNVTVSAIEELGKFLGDIFDSNEESNNFRLFSPDELTSNRLSAVLDHTSLCLPAKIKRERYSASAKSRVMEILSEHVCQGWLQGYLQTGRYGLFATYEAFAPIVASMVGQYCKFLKDSLNISWRLSTPSLNYLLTSLGWHNCYTHQNPDFMGTLLVRSLPFIRIYTPSDANCMLACATEILKSHDMVNLLVASKNPLPVWFDAVTAQDHMRVGASVVKWKADLEDGRTDAVLVGVGDCALAESLAAFELLKKHLPMIGVRVIAVGELTALGSPAIYRHAIPPACFEKLFTANRPVLFNFIGYPATLKGLLADRFNANHFQVVGYSEENAPTPFGMLMRNSVSRFHLAARLAELSAPYNRTVQQRLPHFLTLIEKELNSCRRYQDTNNSDPDGLSYRPNDGHWTIMPLTQLITI